MEGIEQEAIYVNADKYKCTLVIEKVKQPILDLAVTLRKILTEKNYKNFAIRPRVKNLEGVFKYKDDFERFLKEKLVVKFPIKKTNKESEAADKAEIIIEEEDIEIEIISKFKEPRRLRVDDEIIDEKRRTIQVFDVHFYYKKEMIMDAFRIYGPIEKIRRKVDGLYQTVYITYQKVESIGCFYNQQWAAHVNENTGRVIPLLLNNKKRELRKKFSLKLAGLPYNTTGKDLEDIVLKVGGKDCFIPKNPKNYKNLHYAYIHFDNEEKWKNAANKKIYYSKGPIKNQELIFVATAEKLCNMCAKPNHMVKNCPMKDFKKSTNKVQNRYDVDSHWNNMNKTWAQVAKKGNQKNHNNNNNNRNNHPIPSKDNPYENGQVEKEYKESRERKSREAKDIAKKYEEKFAKLIEERSKDLEIIHKAYQDIKVKVSNLDKEIAQIKGNIKIKQSGREHQPAKVGAKRT
jgi:hypothetical protein